MIYGASKLRLKQFNDSLSSLTCLYRFECRRSHVFILLSTLAIIALILGLGLGLTYRNNKSSQTLINDDIPENNTPTSRSDDRITSEPPQKHSSKMGIYARAAVASDGKPCAKIGVYVS